MALTFTQNNDGAGVVGNRRVWRGTVTFDSSYLTGGELVTAADFGFNVAIEHVQVGSTNTARYRCAWVPATGAFMLFLEDGTSGIEAQVASTANVSTIVVHVEASGY